MINIHRVLLSCILVTLVVGLRQSDIGNNDWSRENIGKLTELRLPSFNGTTEQNKVTRQLKSLFFYSELGLFGHINRKTGQIQSRESLGLGERIIQSDQRQLIISTNNGQVVRYNKYTMSRSVDNRLFVKQMKNVHSYVRANNKVFVSNANVIKQFEQSNKKPDQVSTINAPKQCVFQKIFYANKGGQSSLYALTSCSKRGVCLNKVLENLIQLNQQLCLSAQVGQLKYVRVYQNNGYVFFGDQSSNHYINFISQSSQTLNSKPTQFTQFAVKLQNGLQIVTKGIKDKGILRINSNRVDKILYGQIIEKSLNIYLGSQTTKAQKIASINLQDRQFGVQKIWLNYLTQNQFQVIIEFQDLEIVLYNLQGGDFKQVWSREQSLAYMQRVLFMKYQGYVDHLNNQYHIKMDDPQYIQLSFIQKISQIPSNLISRVKSEFQDIYNFFIEKIQYLTRTLKNPQQLLDFKGLIKSSMHSDNQKKYGLQKYIIVITSYNTMFSIDTKTSKIIWKKKYGSESKLVTLIKLKQQYEKQIAIAINYKYHITYITQIHEDGTLTQLQEFQTLTLPTVHKISAHSVLIRADDKVHRFDINKDLLGAQKQYNFYSIQNQNQKVLGWKVVNEQMIQTWTLQLPSSQKIVGTKSAYRGQPQANLPLVNDKKVLFKNVDFSNLALLTIQTYIPQNTQVAKTSYRLHLYIINGLTGTIQFSQYQTSVNPNLPINLVYDEHNAIVSYYNVRNRVYQIWSVQSFQAPLESQLISKKYEPLYQKEDILFRSKVYGTVLPIQHLFISQSKQALLKRNVIIITRQNKLYSLSRQLISTRRPKSADAEENAKSPQSQYITSKYPPEEYILPVNALAFLNYNKRLQDLNNVRFSSSDLESTIFIMAYGVDTFLLRIAPDKAFDMLADGFNYVQLIAVMFGVTVAAIFFRNKSKQAKLKKAHLD